MLYTTGYGIRADTLWQDDVDEAVVIDFIVIVLVVIVKIRLVFNYLFRVAIILIYTVAYYLLTVILSDIGLFDIILI